VEECHQNITTLAQFMLSCDSEHLEPECVPRAGYMILAEIEKLNAVLQEMRKFSPARETGTTGKELFFQ